MSTVKMSPELIATLPTGVVMRVLEGGAPPGSKVVDARIERGGGVEGHPKTVVVDVDDGIEGERCVVFGVIDQTRAVANLDVASAYLARGECGKARKAIEVARFLVAAPGE